MNTETINRNWAIGESQSVLTSIHDAEVNIAIFDRSITPLKKEVDALVQKDIEFKVSGDIQAIYNAMTTEENLNNCQLIMEDVKGLLKTFSELTDAMSFRLLVATISGNMCTKFHTDINDLRMLCTYEGPGTLWLTEDNIDQIALDSGDDDSIVIDPNRIQQAKTGSVVVLKGAIYPKEGTKPILHRSPSIEENGGRRLLLRIDTNEFANF